jgi:glycolate dehydrogenase FAD-linked subunit
VDPAGRADAVATLHRVAADVIAQLVRALPDSRVLTDPDLLETYRRDQADLCPAGMPLAVVRPRSTAEVAATMRIATATRTPVVAQGARTGLAGAANAVDGGLVVSLTELDQILELDPVNQIAVVQPGVVTAELDRAAAAVGLRYPPDPASWQSCTVGGNVATNAGGMCCVKYGVTGEYVLGLEVVLASGEVLRCGRRTRKGVAGYDLTRLLVGSEGTLGVLTEITLALRPAAQAGLSLVAVFDSVPQAGAAVAGIAAAGARPSLLELMDATMLGALQAYRPMDLPASAAALLLAAVDTGDRAAQDLAVLAACCRRAGAREVFEATDPAQADELLAIRRLVHPALERLAGTMFPHGATIIDDVAVPVTRLAELLSGVAAIAAANDVVVAMVGHAGDGNMHPNILIDRADPAVLARGRAAFDQIMALGLALGGTCTGEHGVGLLKRDWLARELGPTGLRIQRAVKDALDPLGILNPGKVL